MEFSIRRQLDGATVQTTTNRPTDKEVALTKGKRFYVGASRDTLAQFFQDLATFKKSFDIDNLYIVVPVAGDPSLYFKGRLNWYYGLRVEEGSWEVAFTEVDGKRHRLFIESGDTVIERIE